MGTSYILFNTFWYLTDNELEDAADITSDEEAEVEGEAAADAEDDLLTMCKRKICFKKELKKKVKADGVCDLIKSTSDLLV